MPGDVGGGRFNPCSYPILHFLGCHRGNFPFNSSPKSAFCFFQITLCLQSNPEPRRSAKKFSQAKSRLGSNTSPALGDFCNREAGVEGARDTSARLKSLAPVSSYFQPPFSVVLLVLAFRWGRWCPAQCQDTRAEASQVTNPTNNNQMAILRRVTASRVARMKSSGHQLPPLWSPWWLSRYRCIIA